MYWNALYCYLDFQDSVAEVQLDALDVLQEMLRKFGQHMVADHPKVLQTLLAQLKSTRSIVRKRAVVSLGCKMLDDSP